MNVIYIYFLIVKQNGGSRAPIDIWKSKFSSMYYGCSERGPHFARKNLHPCLYSFRSYIENYSFQCRSLQNSVAPLAMLFFIYWIHREREK